MKIGVLIPAYNEEKKIVQTINNILQYISDVIVINDNSKDRTKEYIEKFPIILINNNNNKGSTKSIGIGINYMLKNGYDYCIKMDADNQMDASKLIDFTLKIKSEPEIDIVYATYDYNTPWKIKKDMMIYSWLYKLATGIKTIDLLSDFRVYNRKAMEFFIENFTNEGYASPLILIDMHRNNMKSIELFGGVSYNHGNVRPFPIDGLIQFRKSFFLKLYKFGTWRSKIVAIFSMLVLYFLLLFNLIVAPEYNSFLPKRFVR